MKGDISSVGGVLIIVTISIIFGYLLLHQTQLLSDAARYTPSGIDEIRTLQNTLHDPEPTPLATSSSKHD